jgi:hypothetical protein
VPGTRELIRVRVEDFANGRMELSDLVALLETHTAAEATAASSWPAPPAGIAPVALVSAVRRM